MSLFLSPRIDGFNHHFKLLQSTWRAKVSALAPNIQTAPRHRKLFPNKVPLEEQPGLAALAQPRVCVPVYIVQVWGWIHEMLLFKVSGISLGQAADSHVKRHRCPCKLITTGIEENTCRTLLLNQLFNQTGLPQARIRLQGQRFSERSPHTAMRHCKGKLQKSCLGVWACENLCITFRTQGQQSIGLCKCNAVWQWQCSSIQRDLWKFWNSFSGTPKSERAVFVWLRSTFKYSPVVVHCKQAWTLLRSTCELTHVRGLDPELMILNGFNMF